MEPSYRERFSDPAAERAVMQAWESVLSGTIAGPPGTALRALIEGSWQRCLQADVNPRASRGPEPLSEDELFLHRERQRDLLGASQPVLAQACETLAELGTLIALSDTRSVILNAVGDPTALEAGQAIHLMPGVDWSEAYCGTNAIGTALITGQAVQVHSTEHFCEGIKGWTCSAAVIRHPLDGDVVGVLDVSGLSRTYSRQHLAIAMTSARHIESRLRTAEMERRYQLLDAALARFVAAGADVGVILLDHRGCPIKANAQAQRALDDAGAGINLPRLRRIAELALGPHSPRGAGPALPVWLRPEWVEPVLAGPERLGSLLILPRHPPAPGAPRAAAAAQVADAPAPDPFNTVITADPAVGELVEQARRLRGSPVPVLLLGETGVGKELFARGLHSRGPFMVLNCGGLSRELLASELFGYADGAFTGARKGGMRGKIEAAEGGTLFLDEIGEMPLDMQSYLLRVLEEREVYRLGENVARRVNFRLVAATHRDLQAEIKAGRFRMDLYYRIAVVHLHIPALRARKGDVALLAQAFALRFQQEHGKEAAGMEPDALAALEAYPWPGNIRELRNVIESAVLLSSGGSLSRAMLPPEVSHAPAPAPAALGPITLVQGEEDLIRRSIVASGGNLTQSARSLHIAKSTLYAKMKRYGMSREDALGFGPDRPGIDPRDA
ncbi:sigma-54-dependent Fis family transcriptional regulator [Achromobacter denitrificans]|nr:sigma-54-dependent Fis family transcriptional regulator [Achromobacter denitrificans]